MLPLSFFTRNDILAISKQLIGKSLFTNIDGKITGGIITETEAYAGATDKASHAYNNRRTKRTEALFQMGGIAYVYVCYGIHHLLNIVTNDQDIPHGVLIRGIHPTHGLETMLKRRGKVKLDKTLTNGPGAVAQALGITLKQKGESVLGSSLWVEDRNFNPNKNEISIGPRIGIDYAEEDAFLPYRFLLLKKAIKTSY